jgi:hypothetical protein
MSQAEKPTTTNLSRRGALAGLAGAAVAGIAPAIAVAGDDAELLALKAKFDPLFATWVKIQTMDMDRHNSIVELYERATGLRYTDRPVGYDAAYQKAWSKYVDDYFRERDERGEDAPDDDVVDNLLAALNPLADEILSYNASTLDGLSITVAISEGF